MIQNGNNATFPRSAWAADKKQELRNAIDASIDSTGQVPQTASRLPPAVARYGAPMPLPRGSVDVPKMKAYLRDHQLPELPAEPNLWGYKQQQIEDMRPVDGPLKEIYFNRRGEFFVKITPSGMGGSTEPRWYGPGMLTDDMMLDSMPPPAPRYGMPFPRPDVEIPTPSPRYGAPMPEDWK